MAKVNNLPEAEAPNAVTANLAEGDVVPMPKEPEEKVEVAEEVTLMFPEESREPPVKVRPEADESPPAVEIEIPPEKDEVAEPRTIKLEVSNVEVATSPFTVVVPEISAPPCTERELEGVEVPMPTLVFRVSSDKR